jgi:hypothetical protein
VDHSVKPVPFCRYFNELTSVKLSLPGEIGITQAKRPHISIADEIIMHNAYLWAVSLTNESIFHFPKEIV